jgi:hypothetical protein
MIRAALLALAAATLTFDAFAQAYAPPRTADGKPDLQGNWSTAWITPLERPAEASQLVLSASEGAKLFEVLWKRFIDREGSLDPIEEVDVRSLLIVGGEARSSLIVDPPDGKIPFTEMARARRPAPQPPGFDDPEQRGPSERCIARLGSTGPLAILPAGNMRQIVQAPAHLVIFSENNSSLRIIPMGAASGLPGAARGRWEGDVLVVDTTGFAPADRLRRTSFGQFFVSPKSKITERFTRTGPDEILYAFTVEDVDLYARPWTAEFALKRSGAKLYEWGCHEGNYGLANILRGARVLEERAAKKAEP